MLSKKGEMSINDLSKELALSKQSLTSMLDRLYTGGYISKRISEVDKRIILISLREKSNLEVEYYENIVSKMGDIYYKNFSQEEINEFENYLKRIYKNLEYVSNGGK